ncbi:MULTISPECIES: NepR family anti-sigma factor [Microvirga]|uniref:NepR family anti-sigma factor n=1 Tax=Microvirga TaxID=186650 RepID=UPI001CFF6BAB|nr:NepR family anti-sigma factor [Microvirga lenta]MCB5176622.1 hypothetical protein [Microvirga lenta]
MTVRSHNGSEPDSERIAVLDITDPVLSGMIGSRLRAMYDDLLNEPVPERLLEVLQRCDRSSNPPPERGELRNGT